MMVIKEMMLLLVSYPEPTSSAAIQAAIRLAKELGAHVTGIAFAIEMRSPVGFYADPLRVGSLFAAERKKSEANAKELIAQFNSLAAEAGVAHDGTMQHCAPADLRRDVVEHARYADVVVLSFGDTDEAQDLAEALIFDSGRPLLMFPESAERPLSTRFNRVALAWDYSRAAARAVADALPLLQMAEDIRVFTVTGEKPATQFQTGARLISYLARHGLQATFDEVDLAGRSVGDAIESYVSEQAIDLLVMGGYGHSRMAEFVLGGATRSVLAKPAGWTLISH
jgi:nucleotide-binding universal stress UspA family protein